MFEVAEESVEDTKNLRIRQGESRKEIDATHLELSLRVSVA